jgi:cell division protein FtsB
MREFEKKRKIRKFIYSKFIILVLLLLLFLLVRGTMGVYQKSKESNGRENSSAVSLSKLENRKSQLEKDLEILNSNVGIEEQLRTRYSFSREGEKVIIIIDEDVEEIAVPEKKGIVDKTVSWFKGLDLLE